MGKVAKFIVNEMKKRRVLLSTDGPDENIIKIKPPIIFNKKMQISFWKIFVQLSQKYSQKF